jgi:hypothetical protein
VLADLLLQTMRKRPEHMRVRLIATSKASPMRSVSQLIFNCLKAVATGCQCKNSRSSELQGFLHGEVYLSYAPDVDSQQTTAEMFCHVKAFNLSPCSLAMATSL